MPLTVITTLTATTGQTFTTADDFRDEFNPPPYELEENSIQDVSWELTSPTTVVRTITFVSEQACAEYSQNPVPWSVPGIQRN